MISALEALLKSPSFGNIFSIGKANITTKTWKLARDSLFNSFADSILDSDKTAKEIFSDPDVLSVILLNEASRKVIIDKLNKELANAILDDVSVKRTIMSKVGGKIKDLVKASKGIERAFEFVVKKQLLNQ